MWGKKGDGSVGHATWATWAKNVGQIAINNGKSWDALHSKIEQKQMLCDYEGGRRQWACCNRDDEWSVPQNKDEEHLVGGRRRRFLVLRSMCNEGLTNGIMELMCIQGA